MIQIVVVNFGNTGVSRTELARVVAALNVQFGQHFCLPPPYGFGIAASIRAAVGPFDVRPHEWVLGLYEKPDVAGALGYHDETAGGQPLMKVFPLLDQQDGVPWSSTASHEIAETLADPNVARCAVSWDGRVWAYEVGDSVESTSYEIDGVQVSNFVLPPYFEPVKSLRGLKLDWMGLLSRPLQILPGGYGQYLEPDVGWQQVFAQAVPAAAGAAAAEPVMPRPYRREHSGRRARRIAGTRPQGAAIPAVPAHSAPEG